MSTSTIDLPVALATTQTPMSSRRVVRAYLLEAKYTFLTMLRAPIFSIPFLLLPAVMYVFFSSLAESQPDPDLAASFVFVNYAAFGVMGPALMSFGIGIAFERDLGMLAYKRAVPMPPPAYLFSKMAMAFGFSILVLVILTGVSLIMGRLRLSFSETAVLWVTLMFVTLPFCAIGMFVATRASAALAPVIVNLLYLPFMFLGGLFFPLPESMRFYMFLSPPFYVSQLVMSIAAIPTTIGPVPCILVLTAITVVCGWTAMRRIVWKG